MTDGVDIPLQSMSELSESLRVIIAEFDEAGAGSRTGGLGNHGAGGCSFERCS